MSSNRGNVENARRFLWDSGGGDKGGDADASSGTGNRRAGLSRGGGGFSTRDFNVVDQSVNLMDMKADESAAAGAKGNRGGGLFRPSKKDGQHRRQLDTENLSKFNDEMYGDADAMNQAEAEEYIDAKRRRFVGACFQLQRRRPGFKAMLTIALAFMAFLLVFTSFHSFEELEGEQKEEQELEREQNNKDSKVPAGSSGSSSSSSSSFVATNAVKGVDPDHLQEHELKARMKAIQKRIIDADVSHSSVFASKGRGNGGTPQQKALDWLVYEDHTTDETDEFLMDRYGLAVLYYASTNSGDYGGYGWAEKKNWMTFKGICDWHGIECVPKEQKAAEENDYEPFTKKYDENNRVTAILLGDNNIAGILPDELGTAFSELRSLDLKDNKIEGSLPPKLSKATLLKDLLLGNNQLNGGLPQEYVLLRNLHQFSLKKNQLVGPIWNSWESSLTQLRSFSVAHNRLTGTFPDLTKMTKLTGVFLEGNQLKGNLPNSLEGMTSLLDLKIGDNKFSGSIGVLSALSNLESLDLSNNEFTGTIPDMFDKLYRLHELVLPNNQFKGPIPQTLTHLQSLKTLNLDSNQLEGILPPGLGLMTDVVNLSLRYNQFVGTIPTLLGKLDDIQTLSLNHNKLEGPIPTELGACFRLKKLHLQNNQLNATSIPTELGLLVGLSDFRVEENALKEATMPPQICALRDDDLSVLTSDCETPKSVLCECCTDCF